MFRFHQTDPDEPEHGAGAVCPQCGFSVKPRAGWLATRYCPRCRVRLHEAVELELVNVAGTDAKS